MAENPSQYAKLANEGILLGYPVKIAGQSRRPDNNIDYHSTIKFFDPQKDHLHKIHDLAQHLLLNAPDAKNTQIKFDKFKDRMGNDVHVVTLHGNSADKLKEHNGKFAHMGFPATFQWTPHVSVDKGTWDKLKSSGAKTAHEAGIEFGTAVLKRGPRVVKTYNHPADSAEPKIPDESDMTARVVAKNEELLEKGALKNAGIALGMAGALANATPTSAGSYKPEPAVAHQNQYDHQKMLQAISQVESSGGKNTHHDAAGGPIHGSERAYGKFGLMPETIRETIRGHRDLTTKYGKALALKGDILHRYMDDHRGLEDLIADRHLAHMEHVLGNNTDHLSYAWLNGTQGTINAKKKGKNIGNHWYTKRIKEAYNKTK